LQVESTVDEKIRENELRILPSSLQATDEISQSHEAHIEAMQNILKFAKTESGIVKQKIQQIEPESVRQNDVNKLDQYLSNLQDRIEAKSLEWKSTLEQHRRLCQFDADLKEINATLSQLSENLLASRGQYGESVASSRATSEAFKAFEKTIELIEIRIKTFVTSGEELMKTGNSSNRLRVEKDLKSTHERWKKLCDEVSCYFLQLKCKRTVSAMYHTMSTHSQ